MYMKDSNVILVTASYLLFIYLGLVFSAEITGNALGGFLQLPDSIFLLLLVVAVVISIIPAFDSYRAVVIKMIPLVLISTVVLFQTRNISCESGCWEGGLPAIFTVLYFVCILLIALVARMFQGNKI
jgi:hypothetical protein